MDDRIQPRLRISLVGACQSLTDRDHPGITKTLHEGFQLSFGSRCRLRNPVNARDAHCQHGISNVTLVLGQRWSDGLEQSQTIECARSADPQHSTQRIRDVAFSSRF